MAVDCTEGPLPMLAGLYIIVDDEFDAPIYADPSPRELDEGLWASVCEVVQDVFDEERDAKGSTAVGDHLVVWRALGKVGLTFVAIVRDVKLPQVEAYLQRLARRYSDEVDDPRTPDRAGVEDVVVDVIPPWEDEED